MNSSQQGNSYTGSPGINLSLYSLFGQKNIGLFFNYGILIPVINNTGNDYNSSVQLDFHLLGVGFGHDINEKIKLYYGLVVCKGKNFTSLPDIVFSV
jgi:hypothetical protein